MANTLQFTVVGLLAVLGALEAASTSGSAASSPAVFSTDKKLLVTLYYESLCPYSVRFVSDQLNPNYAALKDYIDVVFVPFGKAISYDHGERFECQHGPPECHENMLQSCSLYTLNGSPDAKMAYVACQMNRTVDHTGRECADRLHIDWTEVQHCMDGGLGVQLQLEMERLTHRVRVPYPEGIPTIVFDNVYDKDRSREATEDFKALVCRLIDNAAPVCIDQE